METTEEVVEAAPPGAPRPRRAHAKRRPRRRRGRLAAAVVAAVAAVALAVSAVVREGDQRRDGTTDGASPTATPGRPGATATPATTTEPSPPSTAAAPATPPTTTSTSTATSVPPTSVPPTSLPPTTRAPVTTTTRAATPATAPPPRPPAPVPLSATACGSYRAPRPAPGPGGMEVTVFFNCDADGAGISLYPVYRLVPRTAGVLRSSLQALVGGPTPEERDATLASWFSSETAGALRSVSLRYGHAIVDFQDLRAIIPNASSSAGSPLLLSQLDATVFQFGTVRSVEYRLAGDCEAFNDWLQVGGCERRTRAVAPGG